MSVRASIHLKKKICAAWKCWKASSSVLPSSRGLKCFLYCYLQSELQRWTATIASVLAAITGCVLSKEGWEHSWNQSHVLSEIFGTEGGRQTSSIDLPPMCFLVLHLLARVLLLFWFMLCFWFVLSACWSLLFSRQPSCLPFVSDYWIFYFGPGHQLLLKRNFRFVSCQTWQILSKNGGPFAFCLCSFWVSPNSKQVKKAALPVDRKAPSDKFVIPAWEK